MSLEKKINNEENIVDHSSDDDSDESDDDDNVIEEDIIIENDEVKQYLHLINFFNEPGSSTNSHIYIATMAILVVLHVISLFIYIL